MSAPKTRKTYAEPISLFDRAPALDPRTVEAQSFLAIHLRAVSPLPLPIWRALKLWPGKLLPHRPRSALAHMASHGAARAGPI
jgi:hypothetical protein